MINIEYQDIALNAKNDLTVTCNDKQSFSNLNLLKQTNVKYKKFATLEHNFWKLDGTFENFPDNPEQENIALWSEQMSDENGEFATPIEIILSFENYESAVGLTFKFSTITDDYVKNINVKWYQDDTLLSNKDYELTSADFFCENSVSNFNKIVITCLNTNKPYRYLKLQDCIYGLVRNFEEDELRSLSVLEDVSLTSEELKINTMDFTLNNKKLIDFIFQKKQPLVLSRNGTLIGTFFIESSKRKSATLYEISAVDYIGVMDKMPFAGGTYSNETVSNLVAIIMGNIPYALDENLANKTLSGTLEPCTRREALLQVAFACCAIVDTSRSDKVKIYKNDLTVKSNVAEGIYTGGSFESEDEITEIRITLNDDTQISKKNPILFVDSLENVLEFSGVFISSSNANEVLGYLYDYYVTNKNNKTNLKFIIKNDEKCGDVITYATEYLGTKKGQITQMKFNFNSYKFVAQAELKDLEG